MVRIYTTANTAEVIDLQAGRDRPDKKLVRQPMCLADSVATVPEPYRQVPVSCGIDYSSPFPAIRSPLNPLFKSFPEGNSFLHHNPRITR